MKETRPLAWWSLAFEKSVGHAHLLAETLLEHLFGYEAPHQAEAACDFSRRVANARLLFGGCQHHLVRHGFDGIAGRDAVAPGCVHGCTSLIVDAHDPIGLVAILF